MNGQTVTWISKPKSSSPAAALIVTPVPFAPTLSVKTKSPIVVGFDVQTNQVLKFGRYKLKQKFFCLVANSTKSAVQTKDCGADDIGWTWNPKNGSIMLGSDDDKSSFVDPNLGVKGPRLFLGTPDQSCKTLSLIPFVGDPIDPNSGPFSGISGWQYDGTNLFLTTCSSTTCVDSQSINTEGQVPVLNSNCSKSTNTMQWLFEPFETTTVSGTGRFAAGIVIVLIGFALFFLSKFVQNRQKQSRLRSETRTEQLLDKLSNL